MAVNKSVKKRKISLKKIISFSVGFVLLFVSGLMIYNSVQEFMISYRLNSELKAARQAYEDALGEQAAFEIEKAKFNDPDYVQNYARGAHLLTSEGEQVFILVPEKGNK